MALLGNKLQQAYSATVKDTFNGDGSTVAFTLSRASRTNDVEVFVENVQQEPTVAYSISGTTLTFTAAPVSGTGNIYVIHRTQATQSLTVNTDDITDGAITAAKIASGVIPDAVTKSATAPASPADGDLWYDTTNKLLKVYNSTESDWATVTSNVIYDIEYLLIAGGGGGGGSDGSSAIGAGGGGAGGLLYGTASVNSDIAYSLVVGAGGNGGPSGNPGSRGASGVDTTGFSVTAIGGGGGGAGSYETYSVNIAAADGGSGGGGGWGNGIDAAAGGSGTTGQGYDGGDAQPTAGGSGGGGGAGEAGSPGGASNYDGGDGGDGLNTYSAWATATSTGDSGYYSGGGGAGTYVDGTSRVSGAGGLGGGGAGGSSTYENGVAGTANTGGGGGGAARVGATSRQGSNGGSGIIIVRYAGSQRGTGGTIVESGGYTYHTFTSSGTFTA